MTQHDLEKYFAFLDGLRCSGACNMFAAYPYLMDAFYLEQEEAKRVWSLWSGSFALNTPPEDRAAEAFAAERAH
jgi:hypothetical protein